MNKSDSIAALAAALCKTQASIKAAEMNAVNPFLKNKYADLGSVIEAARQPMTANGLSCSQLVGGSSGTIELTTILMHSSGEWLSETVSLPVGDEKGKSLAQSAGSVITYLRRYSLAAMLGIYADEDTDGNERKPQAAQQERQPQPRPANGDSQKRPLAPDVLADFLDKKSKVHAKGGHTASDKQRSLVAMLLNEIFGGDKDARHLTQELLFGASSLTDADDAMILAALDWLKPISDSGGAYKADLMAAKEAQTAYSFALNEFAPF